MSVIAGRVYTDKIVIAADSIMVRGWSKKQNRTKDFQKLAQVNGMIIGSVGTVEEGCLMLLFAETHKPARADERAVTEFLAEFTKWARDYAEVKTDNSYLIAYDGKLFSAEGFNVMEVSGFESIGAGEDFSNTAMHLGHDPKRAVEVACDMCCMTCGPIVKYEMKVKE